MLQKDIEKNADNLVLELTTKENDYKALAKNLENLKAQLKCSEGKMKTLSFCSFFGIM